jgi:hypothetical protein
MATMRRSRRLGAAALALLLVAVLGGTGVLLAACGPFTDVGTLICPFVLELYYTGITAGTSSTTFSPNDPVTRGQMAVFIATTIDRSLARGSRRAALNQWWTTSPQFTNGLGTTTIGGQPMLIQSDGADLWVADLTGNVVRIRTSDGAILGTWTGAVSATGVLVAMGRVFITGQTSPGSLYMIDPTQPPGSVTTVATTTPLGDRSFGIAFDGTNIWTANQTGGSVSLITPGSAMPWASTNVTTGFSGPLGLAYDGSNMWVTDNLAGTLDKLDASANILQSVNVAPLPRFPIFDGHNIWVTGGNPSVVAASSGTIIGPGIGGDNVAAFDGERIMVTSYYGNSVSLWKAADLTPLGTFSTGTGSQPFGVCSDGLNFWIVLPNSGQIARF